MTESVGAHVTSAELELSAAELDGFASLELDCVMLLELGADASDELLSAAFSLELSILLLELVPGATAGGVF